MDEIEEQLEGLAYGQEMDVREDFGEDFGEDVREDFGEDVGENFGEDVGEDFRKDFGEDFGGERDVKQEIGQIEGDGDKNRAGRTWAPAIPANIGGKVQGLSKIPAPRLELRGKLLSVAKSSGRERVFPQMAPKGLEPNSSVQSIPLDKDAIVRHYVEVSPQKKRGRPTSPESQHNKSLRRSASHSTAITRNPSPSVIPSTKWSTRGPSPSVIPSAALSTQEHSPGPDEHDPQGSSRTTGGHIRGKALGSAFRFADAGKFILMLMLAYYDIFPL